MRNATRRNFDVVAYGEEFGRCRVLHLAILIENGINAFHQSRKSAHSLGHAGQGGIFAGFAFLLTVRDDSYQVDDGAERAFEVEEFELFHVSAIGTNTHQGLTHIKVVLLNIYGFLHKTNILAGLLQGFDHFSMVGEELQSVVHPLCAQRRHTPPFEQGAYVLKSYLFLKTFGVYHSCF